MANGKRYQKDGIFVANKTYPFGTRLRVTNLRNNRSVVVVVTDRGPYPGGPGHSLDLSYAAAKQLDMIQDGIVLVSYTKIPNDPKNTSSR